MAAGGRWRGLVGAGGTAAAGARRRRRRSGGGSAAGGQACSALCSHSDIVDICRTSARTFTLHLLP